MESVIKDIRYEESEGTGGEQEGRGQKRGKGAKKGATVRDKSAEEKRKDE